jgi:hypothetical protein
MMKINGLIFLRLGPVGRWESGLISYETRIKKPEALSEEKLRALHNA